MVKINIIPIESPIIYPFEAAVKESVEKKEDHSEKDEDEL